MTESKPTAIAHYRARIDAAMRVDRFSLRRRMQKIGQLEREGNATDQLQTRWLADLERSIMLRQQREEQVAVCRYPEDLPVSQRRAEIANMIEANQVIILAGETGSGKTTQLPKICLDMGRGRAGLIGHTQPRRLAARTVAARIAEELAVPLGKQVGFQVRFSDQSQPDTLIKLMTDGILLAEIQQDRFLERYDTLIIDEAHERSLNIDFLLGYIKRILPKRPDLKVIVTSATIDLERFSRHFDNAPVIEVSGRSYPVEMVYRPVGELDDVTEQSEAIIRALEEIIALEKQDASLASNGDVLVFLSGEREIRDTALALRRAQLPHCEVLPLYARLSVAEQNRVFDARARAGRRIVLATNVAETSLTVPGIHYVIDPGFARISRYSYRTKVQRLPIESISQASANQRAGRCGRIADGVCIRLYEEQDFLSRPAFTDPEIQRTNLASVILQMLSMGLGDINAFPFVDPPDRRMVSDGFKLLEELGAVDHLHKLTATGRSLARLPVDPRIAAMVLMAAKLGSLHEVLIIASGMSIQDPRERPADKQQAADQQHQRFADEQSDFIALLKLWDYYEQQRQALSNSQLRKTCQKEFLSAMRMREWRDVHHQLKLAIRDLGLQENQQPADYATIHRALLAGLLSHIGFKYDNKDYLGARNRRFKIFPGSFVAKKPPKWLMAAELVETTQLYARMVASIEAEWLPELAGHLVKRSYDEPHWQQKRGQVVAYEKLSLFGLVISDRKTVDYSKIDPQVARQIFIQSALVEEQLRSNAPFYQYNRQQVRQLHELEAKARRRDILVDEKVLYDFYDERLPTCVCDVHSLDRWRQTAEKRQPRLLMIDPQQLFKRDASDVTQQQFPDELQWQGIALRLQYRFEPGHPQDGVTVIIPLGILNRVPEYLFDWLVPGLLRDKCIALIKSLPKQLRKHFVPVPDWVDQALQNMTCDNSPLVRALAAALKQVSGVSIPDDAWQNTALDDFYRMNCQIVSGDQGRQTEVLGQGRDLQALVRRFRDRVQESLAAQTDHRFDSGFTEWTFDDLGKVHCFEQAGVTIEAYPALVDQGDSVAVELFDYANDAQIAHRQGLVRLLILANKQALAGIRKDLLRGNQAMLQITVLAEREVLVDDMLSAIVNQTFLGVGVGVGEAELPRSKADYQSCLQARRGSLVSVANHYHALLQEIISLHYVIRKRLPHKPATSQLASLADVRQQLDGLLYGGFIYATPLEWLEQYPRYLKAVEQRLEKLTGQAQKDQQASVELTKLSERLNNKCLADPLILAKDQQLRLYRWMLEEYRVSLFAQHLGTRMPVSVKRLDKQWQQVESP